MIVDTIAADQTIEIDGARRCGRPTKSGTRCRALLAYSGFISCKLHRAAGDDEIEWGYRRGMIAARQDEEQIRRCAMEAARAELRRETELERRRQEEAAAFRTQEGGAQIVVVDGYTYRWFGDPLAVGDRVMLPPPPVSQMKHGPGPVPGVVTALGSSYRGALSSVLRVVERVAELAEVRR